VPKVTTYLAAIEDDLRQAVPDEPEPYRPLSGMLRYHLGWQDARGAPVVARHGKRLRPLFCLLACEATGGEWRQALPAATAVELIHNATLIHDDIEDASPTRHQRATVWSLCGIGQAINAGDMLWALGRRSLYRLAGQGVDPERVSFVSRLLDETCASIFRGQYLDMATEGDLSVREDTYLALVQGKTAALIGASLQTGAALGCASSTLIEQLGRFGQHLGMAFQITDDLLGIWGDPEVTGKPAGDDLLARKMTLPVILALAWEQTHAADELSQMWAQPPSAQDLPEAMAILERYDIRATVEQRAREAQEHMMSEWEAMGLVCPAAETLRDLALSLAGRRF